MSEACRKPDNVVRVFRDFCFMNRDTNKKRNLTKHQHLFARVEATAVPNDLSQDPRGCDVSNVRAEFFGKEMNDDDENNHRWQL
jgi:hypothetical protein